jgi:hypothetical protein
VAVQSQVLLPVQLPAQDLSIWGIQGSGRSAASDPAGDEDALRQAEVSVMEYADIHARTLPDYIFTKEYLKKLD